MAKITRAAFIYLAPRVRKPFAQCSTCRNYLSGKHRCAFLGDKSVPSTASCGLYVPGQPSDEQHVISSVSPTEAGYVNATVRCENCAAYLRVISECNLYKRLNTALPQMFALDVKVKAQGCCNAWEPK